MRLPEFLALHRDRIVDEAERFATTLLPHAAHDRALLRDHIPLILDAFVEDLLLPQTRAEALAKSEGNAPRIDAPQTASETHGMLRAQSGMDIEQLVAEYRALRATVLRLWSDEYANDSNTVDDMIRFNEAVDQAIAESVAYFTAEVERWRAIFLGVLGHDLRGPLNAIVLTAQVLSRETRDSRASSHAAVLLRSGQRMASLLDDLLEYNKTSLGIGMLLRRAETDLVAACRQEIEILRASLPTHDIQLLDAEPAVGSFDASRVREALGNLINNACKYGTQGVGVVVRVQDEGSVVRVSVENAGPPLSEDEVARLFEPLQRGGHVAANDNLGLGLFIVRQIARAHGGDVTVRSEGGRTNFSMVLPKAHVKSDMSPDGFEGSRGLPNPSLP